MSQSSSTTSGNITGYIEWNEIISDDSFSYAPDVIATSSINVGDTSIPFTWLVTLDGVTVTSGSGTAQYYPNGYGKGPYTIDTYTRRSVARTNSAQTLRIYTQFTNFYNGNNTHVTLTLDKTYTIPAIDTPPSPDPDVPVWDPTDYAALTPNRFLDLRGLWYFFHTLKDWIKTNTAVDVADYITDEGTSNGWSYQLYKSGRIHAFRTYDYSCSTQGYVTPQVALPFTMADTNYSVQVNHGIWRVTNAYEITANRTTTEIALAFWVDSAGADTATASLTLDGFIGQQ